jgi:uridine monophosphate synthetase
MANREMTQRQRAFADGLLESGAVRFGAFRLKLHERQPDAPLAPIYVNLRAPQSFPDVMDAMVAALRELIEAHGLVFTRYAGIPMAATPMTAVLSHLTRIPMITPREPKTHGLTGSIDGAYTPGETVLVLDDLVTHAESKLDAIRVLEGAGLLVRDIAVLIDREQGGVAQLAQAGYTLHSAVTLRQLLDYWRAVDGISEETYTTVRTYLEA